MRITSLKLKNFKRFTDLSIDGIPDTAKLVLLIGANGSGKSSIFDAINFFKRGYLTQREYYDKVPGKKTSVEIIFSDNTDIERSENQLTSRRPNVTQTSLILPAQVVPGYINKLYGRSSIRIVPRIDQGGAQNVVETDADSPATYIEPDLRFNNDVYYYMQQINNALRGPVFKGEQADTIKIFQDFIKPLNDSLQAIFEGDERTAIRLAEFQDAGPQKLPQLIFTKGSSKINYDLLSHGEKQVVILLLDFIVRNSIHQDTIFYIDEMDCHLNTSLQKNLLREIVTRWIPDGSQLWTATHALGFIDYAKEADDAVIIDFDLYNFDQPRSLSPAPKDSLAVYDVALPQKMIFEILKGHTLIVCENKNDKYYNLLAFDHIVFVGVRDAREVFLTVKNDARYRGLRDRDFLSDTEINKIRKAFPALHILHYYDFENFLFHPDNLEELNPLGFDKPAYIQEIIAQKKAKFPYITATIISSRMGYEEFKTNEGFKDKDVKSIIDDLNSDNFETFYKFFDMKEQFDKTFLANYNLKKEDLTKTAWFKKAIEMAIK